MTPPKIPENPPPSSATTMERLIKSVEADKSFAGRRDAAILCVFLATGARLSEVANLRWNPGNERANDVDLDMGIIRVIGKGNRERPIYIGAKAVKALDRYIFDHRAKHPLASGPRLWLSAGGHFTPSGITQMVASRGEAVGLRVHPHAFRHRWAHTNLANGMQEGEVMSLVGWRSLEMLPRYAASTATERALDAARRSGIADRI